MAWITDTEFKKLKNHYYELGRVLTLSFYGENTDILKLLREIDSFRKHVVKVVSTHDIT